MKNNKKSEIGLMSQEEFEKKLIAKDPGIIESYFNETLAEYAKTGNKEDFFKGVAKVVKWVGVANVAAKAHLSRQGVYKAIRADSSPSFTTVLGVLHGAGFNFKVNHEKTA
jgi:DNA-binding phage protein